jgi:maltooligosyltrehalose trehalohydrolase
VLADPEALEAAIALLLLAPQIPLIFMGEEVASETPFLFFTDHNKELAKAVREGRRWEFASFSNFSKPEMLAQLPDPNAIETFERSKPVAQPQRAAARRELYGRLLTIRRTEIMPRLSGARALDATALGAAAVMARWRMGDGARLAIASNFGHTTVPLPPASGRPLFASSDAAASGFFAGQMPAHSTVAVLDSP